MPTEQVPSQTVDKQYAVPLRPRQAEDVDLVTGLVRVRKNWVELLEEPTRFEKDPKSDAGKRSVTIQSEPMSSGGVNTSVASYQKPSRAWMKRAK